jgi:transcriptional regulator with XRE-family HTH domain
MATATRQTRRAMPRRQKEPDQTTYKGRLGANIRKRREQLGLKPAHVADIMREHGADIGEKSVYAYELGTTGIDLDHLPALAAALNTSIRKLLPAE